MKNANKPGNILVQFKLDLSQHPDMWMWNHEPVYHNGEPRGWVTSSAYSFTEQAHICWAALHDVIIKQSDSFHVKIAEKDISATQR